MAKHKILKKIPNTPLKRVCVKEEPKESPKEEPKEERKVEQMEQPIAESKVEQMEQPIAEAKEEQKENAPLVSHEDNLFEKETQDETSTDNIFEKETQQEEESQYQYPTDYEIIDLTGDN